MGSDRVEYHTNGRVTLRKEQNGFSQIQTKHRLQKSAARRRDRLCVG